MRTPPADGMMGRQPEGRGGQAQRAHLVDLAARQGEEGARQRCIVPQVGAPLDHNLFGLTRVVRALRHASTCMFMCTRVVNHACCSTHPLSSCC
jgi:hypothetical protein